MKLVFDENGTVTAGTSSPLTDGAAATLVCNENYAKKNNLPILAKIISTAVNGCPPELMGLGPIGASKKALKRANLDIKDMEKINNVDFMKGDITNSEIQNKIFTYFNKKIDVVISDMAANTTGNKNLDSYKTGELCIEAMDLAQKVLREDGVFLSKID